MLLIQKITASSALLAVVHGQAVLLTAQATKGSPASLGLQVDPSSPDDANFISDIEITTNVANECGRTLLAGNIDIGENTENALADGNITQATAGSNVFVRIRQVNNAGAGPFTCDMDPTGNSIGATGQTKLATKEAPADKNGNIALLVAMPQDMKCIGASTGNVCTVRCRNANNFGGCFAVQQIDISPNVNTPTNIDTLQSLDNVLQQVAQNIADLPAAMDAIAGSGQSPAGQGTAVVDKIQAADPSTVDNVRRKGQRKGQRVNSRTIGKAA